MRTMTGTVRRWGFGGAMAAALAFGGARAMAAPAPAQVGDRVCDARLCDRVCQTLGSIGGVCNPDGFCVCFL